jgi:hypothetical protein
MTRRPFDPTEAGDLGPDMDATLADLDRYLADTAEYPSPAFADHIMESLAREPTPRRGLVGGLLAFVTAPGSGGRLVLVAATMAVAILAVIAAGQLGNLLPPPNVGGSPSPTTIVSPSTRPSPTPSPSPSPRDSRSPRPSSSEAPQDSPDARELSSSAAPSDHSGTTGGSGEDSGPTSSED